MQGGRQKINLLLPDAMTDFFVRGEHKHMRKKVRVELIGVIKQLNRAGEALQRTLHVLDPDKALEVITECQEGAIIAGNKIEQQEGEGTYAVKLLEDYCEELYLLSTAWEDKSAAAKHIKKMRDLLTKAANSVRYDLPESKKEIVFLPYKASMWDSMESVWKAAKEDKDCEVYVIPIPYFDKNPDGTLGELHYEGMDFPDDVPITYYEHYSLEAKEPDVIYIHNPYDEGNTVTSVAPDYYSRELKKYTDCLVYIPYYATAGGMSTGQALCAGYLYADYIVLQAEKFRKFIDPMISQEKLLILGSPKFDKVIRLCANPPEPPAEWKETLRGKKVYFYNTSIGGMLGNTYNFLQKMKYVFECFMGRKDTCLIWRPHPLLESTFESMRKEYHPVYQELKQYFIQNQLGIYDDTPDMEKTIALCDAYIGDSGTSVTAMFGLAGKPLFILNNNIHTAPEPEDWRGEIIPSFCTEDSNEWIITQGNKLYRAQDQDYRYRYVCDLSEYAYGCYYSRALEVQGKVYVCPANAQNILVVADGKIERRIELKRYMEYPGAFFGAWKAGDYLYLLPNKYPAIVRYDIQNDKLDYIHGYSDFLAQEVQGETLFGGSCIWRDYLLLASPTEDRVLQIHIKTMEAQEIALGTKQCAGWRILYPQGENIWLLPTEDGVVTRWNPETGELREYDCLPEGFQCEHRVLGFVCMRNPFGIPAFGGKYMYLPPCWGNMYVRLNTESGKAEKWIPPFPVAEKEKNGYYAPRPRADFLTGADASGDEGCRLFSSVDRKLYKVDLERGNATELPMEFDAEELRAHEAGFCEDSEWLQYACDENAFNSLRDFLDKRITGAAFDREKQLQAFGRIAVNGDGTCGRKLHEFIKSRL